MEERNMRNAEDRWLSPPSEDLVRCIYCDGHGKYICPPCDGAGELDERELAEWDEERVIQVVENGYHVPVIKPVDIRPVEINLCGACGTFMQLCWCRS